MAVTPGANGLRDMGAGVCRGKAELSDEQNKQSKTAHEARRMSVDTSEGHPAMDYNEHKRTFAGFMQATKMVTVLLVLILIGMAFFLT